MGQAHAGVGKLKVDDHHQFHDAASVAALADCYSTVEPLVDTKYDLYIQKIGQNYKAFIRKSISANWKANTGSAMLEQIPVNETFKLWADEVSKLFGGLDIVRVQVVCGQDGKHQIIDIQDSAMPLLGG